jgi:hypothetical protein
MSFEAVVRTGGEPKPWRPQPGDSLVGTLDRFETRNGLYGEFNCAILVADDGSEHSVALTPKQLQSTWTRWNPQVGERVGLRYVGERQSQDRGITYRTYYLRVHRPTPEPPQRPAPRYDQAGNPLIEGRSIVVDDEPAEVPW